MFRNRARIRLYWRIHLNNARSRLIIVIVLWICAAIITVDSIDKGFQYYIGGNHFGALVVDSAAVGAAVIVLPGKYVQNNSIMQAGTIYCKNEAVTQNDMSFSGKIFYLQKMILYNT